MTKPTGLVLPVPGREQLPLVESFDYGFVVSRNTYFGANNAYLYRVRVASPLSVTTMAYSVGTASGNVDLGIYIYDGANYQRIASTGSTAAAGSSTRQEIALTAAVTLVPGVDYWLAMAADNTTLTVARFSPIADIVAIGNRILFKAASFPLPTSIASPAATGAGIYVAAF